jgi:hypothetical protein
MSTGIFGHPLADLGPREPKILAKPNDRQRVFIAHFGPIAGLLKYPTLRNLQAIGELLGGQDVLGP